MYAPPPPPPAPAPRPAPVPGVAPSPRYAFLVGRLRTRQITMEEATELFGIMDAMVRAGALAAAAAAAEGAGGASGESAGPGAAGARAPVASSAPVTPFTDEGLALGLLGFGVGAGLLAAVFKRARDGPLGSTGATGRAAPPAASR